MLFRLKRQKDIEDVFRRGKNVKGPLLFLRLAANHLESSRFCFIVSAKVAKKATTRNQIRRRLSEIIKTNSLSLKGGFDVLIIVSPGADRLSFPDLEKTLNDLLRQAKLLC